MSSNRPEVRLVEHPDPTRGIVLVSGRPRKVVEIVLDVAGLLDQARWSDEGDGWVIDARDAAAVEAACTASLVRFSWRRRSTGGDDDA